MENAHTIASLSDRPALEPGKVVGLVGPPGFGLTRVGLSMLAIAVVEVAINLSNRRRLRLT